MHQPTMLFLEHDKTFGEHMATQIVKIPWLRYHRQKQMKASGETIFPEVVRLTKDKTEIILIIL